MGKEKYALLDTDFIVKTNLIQNGKGHRWIDQIMKLPGYRFGCHSQIEVELQRHDQAYAYNWLEQRIIFGEVHRFDDEEILDELTPIYGNSAVMMYTQMLKTGCDAYRNDCFAEYFSQIDALDLIEITKEQFLTILRENDESIGVGKNLGEIKTYVLLQMLQVKYASQVYVFCSDDKNARNGIISIGQTNCISVLTSFSRLHQEYGLRKEDAVPYLESYLAFCKQHKQETFRVLGKDGRVQRVPCEQVIEDLFDGKMEELRNGSLRYLSYQK